MQVNNVTAAINEGANVNNNVTSSKQSVKVEGAIDSHVIKAVGALAVQHGGKAENSAGSIGGTIDGDIVVNESDDVYEGQILRYTVVLENTGEETISSYFKEGNGKDLESLMPAHQWSDLVSFEGNANAFRQLTHQFAGRRQGGMSLTYATLATLIKYPYPSFNKKGKKKYNIFHSEIDTFKKVMDGCGIVCLDEETLAHNIDGLKKSLKDVGYHALTMKAWHTLVIHFHI